MKFLVNAYQFLMSFLFGVCLEERQSTLNGKLSVWLINGKKCLESENANYSYASLHKVFQKAFKIKNVSKNEPKAVLVLGFGAGSIVSILKDEYKFKSAITAIEYDSVILELGRKHFEIDQFKDLNLIEADANIWLDSNSQTFDLIAVDLFHDREVPAIFRSEDFIQKLISHLKPGGQVFFNLISESEEEKKDLEVFFQLWKKVKIDTEILKISTANSMIWLKNELN